MPSTGASLLIGFLIAAATAGGYFFRQSQNGAPQIEAVGLTAFERWSRSQNKVYATPSEKNYRMNNFFRNLATIEASNKDSSLTYKSGLNQFSDLTEEEFLAKYTGFMGIDRKNGLPHVSNGVVNDDVDWRKKGAVNAVKDQKQCGSCWAFSAISSFESAWQIHGNQLAAFSEQQLVDCSGDFGNYGCDGGLMNNAFDYFIKESHGVELSKDYPYTAMDGDCQFDSSKIVGTMSTYHIIDENDCDGLLHAITQQPVSVAIAANAIMSYKSGIFNNPRCGVQLNHGVTAVGYGEENGTEFWIVRNSWGPNWGEQGYIRMFRDDNKSEPGMCGICLASSYPVI
jgi:KDEL-tailed cysteine endopeptidase